MEVLDSEPLDVLLVDLSLVAGQYLHIGLFCDQKLH